MLFCFGIRMSELKGSSSESNESPIRLIKRASKLKVITNKSIMIIK